ncbi:tRNA (adenine(58)-N(1))-methyltransferase catalytic subunit GCD14 [Penicillium cf. griseofulvum]|nr:tRNA (adenine(58)-N(1))-methyltransferase catalytic subunit GCD14 [Penicillium cf. griseofulvum]
MPSPFFTRDVQADADSLALLQLRRDQIVPTILRDHDDENQGYWEGKVTNTRFGSFPHSTLIGQPWGSQVVASKVDTGSRGRNKQPAKRKAEELDAEATSTGAEEEKKPSLRAPVTADSGFLHILAPTPEAWTISLPHRTQVVYTPDYSYILHRLRVRPGCTVIEAGAGSGSFTHASARAVFNGYPGTDEATKRQRLGKVCSFEFHEQRAAKVQQELRDHGLDGIVEATHRDVYEDGFLLGDPKTGKSPKANAIFLDLPAPWLALKHLVRNPPPGQESALDPDSPAYICTFSPCLEQAERTIRTMRKLSWLNISMVEVAQRRLDVKRDRIGLDTEGVRGATLYPKTVEEAVAKLRSDEQRAKLIRDNRATKDHPDYQPIPKQTPFYKEKTEVPLYAQGRLTHRSEPDLRTHTSYLVFAILPRAWTEEQEQKCRDQWPSAKVARPDEPKTSKKQMKRQAAMERAKLREEQKKSEENPQPESEDNAEEEKIEEEKIEEKAKEETTEARG